MKLARPFFIVFLTCATWLTLDNHASAKGKGGKSKKSAPQAKAPSKGNAKVTAINAKSITIGGKAFTLTTFTEVTINGAPRPVSAIRVGMEGSAEGGTDGVQAERIDLHDATSHPASKASSKKGKK